MILKFPDLDTLRLALVTGAVPPAVTQTPASAGFADQGPVWVQTAALDRAKGVWVQVGHAHPRADQVKPPEGKVVLTQPPRTWTLLPDGPFQDIYGVLEFSLPDGETPYKEGSLAGRVGVRLSLR